MTGAPEELARVAAERHGETVLARLSGEIDLSNAAAVEDLLTHGVGGATAVAVDLSGLSYLDSAGLALLSRLSGRLAGRSGQLRLVVPPDAVVGRTLSISGLPAAIPVDETVEAALAALDRRS
ncbi:MAG TPA: anti-sigma factor antagonist [Mycobacteriales bacterium]|jgi:anti-anti-sigma factor|nr:anti-sigma factor antagonist [Mycobacteriales bacterium]